MKEHPPKHRGEQIFRRCEGASRRLAGRVAEPHLGSDGGDNGDFFEHGEMPMRTRPFLRRREGVVVTGSLWMKTATPERNKRMTERN